jgi:hypothetical protein
MTTTKEAPVKAVQRHATNTIVARTTVDVLFDGDVKGDADAVLLSDAAGKLAIGAATDVAGTGEHVLTLKKLRADRGYSLRYLRGGATSVIFADTRIARMLRAGELPPQMGPTSWFWEDEHYTPASDREFAQTPADLRAGAMRADEEE